MMFKGISFHFYEMHIFKCEYAIHLFIHSKSFKAYHVVNIMLMYGRKILKFKQQICNINSYYFWVI